MYHSIDKRFLYCAIFLEVMFRDEYEKLHTFSGTGFLLSREARVIGLVTNRHVLDASYSNANKIGWKLECVNFRGFRLDGSYLVGQLDSPVLYFPNDFDEDVALAYFKEIFVIEDTGSGSLIDIDVSVLAEQSYFDGVNPGDFIVFPGFPGWADQATGRPIIRSGVLASDPTFDYTGPSQSPGARRIALEAFSFSGSSGSPVFALSCGISVGTGLISSGSFRPLRLIGINAGSFRDVTESGRQHAGISYMFKSTIILELAEIIKEQSNY